MSASQGSARAVEASWVAREGERGLALGLVACAPLLAAYELALAAHPRASRSAAELLGAALTRPFGGAADAVRRALLGALVLWALVVVVREPAGLLPRLARRVGEGLLGALALGPALWVLLALAGLGSRALELASHAPAAPPSLARAGFVAGGAVWEELVFRLGLYPALFVLLERSGRFLDGGSGLSRWSAELGAPLLSSLLFAASHLAALTAWLGPGGEPFDPLVFTWRALAGMLFCGLFRWRGLAVAAWAHALFDLGLLLGAGPEVFLLGRS